MVYRRVNRCYKYTTQEFNFILDLFTLLNFLRYHHPSKKSKSDVSFSSKIVIFNPFLKRKKSPLKKWNILQKTKYKTDERETALVA